MHGITEVADGGICGVRGVGWGGVCQLVLN